MAGTRMLLCAVMPLVVTGLLMTKVTETDGDEVHPVPHRGYLDVGAVKGRGTLTSGPMRARRPDEYKASPNPESHGYTFESAILDGGGEEIPLFPGAPAPIEQAGDAGQEIMAKNDLTDSCAKGDQAGYSILNVSEPQIVPFIVPRDAPHRRDVAVIVAPGGGGRFLSWSKEGTAVAKWLNRIGISAFVLKYRVPANTIETGNKQLIDAQRAVSLVRSRAEEWGLNKSRIGFGGFSNGGIITASVSMQPKRQYAAWDEADNERFRPDFALVIYGMASPPDLVNVKGAPPTFLALASDDPCIPLDLAKLYYNALPGDSNELHIFSGGSHGYGDCSLYVDGNEWEPVCAWTVLAQGFIENLYGLQRPLDYKAMTMPGDV